MSDVKRLPAHTTYHRSRGDARFKLRLHPHDKKRMIPVLLFTDQQGGHHSVELTAADAVQLLLDLDEMFCASKGQVSDWYHQLTGQTNKKDSNAYD